MSPVQTRIVFPERKLRSRALSKKIEIENDDPSCINVSPRERKRGGGEKRTPLVSENRFVYKESSPVKRKDLGSLEKNEKSFETKEARESLEDSSPTKKDRLLDSESSSSIVKIDKVRHRLFGEARSALSPTNIPNNLAAREKQLDFINNFLLSSQRKSLYISGAPGTGKTASLTHSLHQKSNRNLFTKVIWINCLALNSPNAVFEKMLSQLDISEYRVKRKDAESILQSQLTQQTTDKRILLILDEIDQLESKNQSILYTLFEWPHLKDSKLKLIGIANSLDLTDRILPRLKIHSFCPEQLSFPTYKKEDILQILKLRLPTLDDGSYIIKPVALNFLAAKISAHSGDIRKALDVCRRSLEMAETHSEHASSIDLPQILKVIQEVYGSRVEASIPLPLVQKLLLATLCLMTKNNYFKEIVFSKLYGTYVKVCSKRKISSVSESESLSMISLMEVRGLVSCRSGKEPRLAKLSLRIDETEVESALQDKTLLSEILRDTNCIVK